MNTLWNLGAAHERIHQRTLAVLLCSVCYLTFGNSFAVQAGQDEVPHIFSVMLAGEDGRYESRSYLLESLEQCNAVANAVVVHPGIYGAVCTIERTFTEPPTLSSNEELLQFTSAITAERHD